MTAGRAERCLSRGHRRRVHVAYVPPLLQPLSASSRQNWSNRRTTTATTPTVSRYLWRVSHIFFCARSTHSPELVRILVPPRLFRFFSSFQFTTWQQSKTAYTMVKTKMFVTSRGEWVVAQMPVEFIHHVLPVDDSLCLRPRLQVARRRRCISMKSPRASKSCATASTWISSTRYVAHTIYVVHTRASAHVRCNLIGMCV